jgi:uncharacterized coiled-coil DUF342 family protein
MSGDVLIPGALVGGPLIFAVFFVLRGIMRFQRDFTDTYARELTALRAQVDEQDAKIDLLRDEVAECEADRRALMAERVAWRRERDQLIQAVERGER